MTLHDLRGNPVSAATPGALAHYDRATDLFLAQDNTRLHHDPGGRPISSSPFPAGPPTRRKPRWLPTPAS